MGMLLAKVNMQNRLIYSRLRRFEKVKKQTVERFPEEYNDNLRVALRLTDNGERLFTMNDTLRAVLDERERISNQISAEFSTMPLEVSRIEVLKAEVKFLETVSTYLNRAVHTIERMAEDSRRQRDRSR